MLLNRRKLRVIYDGADITTQVSSPNSDPVDLPLTTLQDFYIGWHDKFASRYFFFETLNATPVGITIKYWNGSSFVEVEDFIDQTQGFTANGFISWVNQSDWQKTAIAPLNDEQLFWIKFEVDGDLDAGTELSAIMNLFCDDEVVRGIYPEVIADSRYLPPGRTNFLDQYLAAKDLVVTRLIQKKVILDESQVIDINQVALASAYAAVSIIMTPIARSEQAILIRDGAKDHFEALLNGVSFAVDDNKDGVVSDAERSQINTGFIYRR